MLGHLGDLCWIISGYILRYLLQRAHRPKIPIMHVRAARITDTTLGKPTVFAFRHHATAVSFDDSDNEPFVACPSALPPHALKPATADEVSHTECLCLAAMSRLVVQGEMREASRNIESHECVACASLLGPKEIVLFGPTKHGRCRQDGCGYRLRHLATTYTGNQRGQTHFYNSQPSFGHFFFQPLRDMQDCVASCAALRLCPDFWDFSGPRPTC